MGSWADVLEWPTDSLGERAWSPPTETAPEVADSHRPAVPTSVWVAGIVITSEILVKDKAATQPLASREALFAPKTYKHITNARMIGAWPTQEEAEAATRVWQAANPGIQGDPFIECVPFGAVDEFIESAKPIEQYNCITCGKSTTQGFFCEPHRKEALTKGWQDE